MEITIQCDVIEGTLGQSGERHPLVLWRDGNDIAFRFGCTTGDVDAKDIMGAIRLLMEHDAKPERDDRSE